MGEMEETEEILGAMEGLSKESLRGRGADLKRVLFMLRIGSRIRANGTV